MFMPGQSTSAFTIELVSETQKVNMLTVRSVLDGLREVTAIFKANRKQELELVHFIKAINILSKLLCFVHDIDFVEGVDMTEHPLVTEPLKDRQAIMREMGVIDLLMDLVHFPFQNQFFTVTGIERPLYISKVIGLGYISIKSIIKERRANELHASQWLEMFVEYALQDSGNVLRVKDTLTELIDNNEKILEIKINEAIIMRIINFFLSSPADEKIVAIIRAMCSCGGQPVLKNQEMISRILFSDQLTFSKVLSEHKTNDQSQVVLINPWDNSASKTIRLKDLKEKSEAIDKGRYFEYYLSMLALISELCAGRNYMAINLMKEYFPLEVLVDVLCDQQFGPELRTAFSRLLEVMYIDVYPCQRLSIPHLVRDLAKVSVDSSNLEIAGDANDPEINRQFKKLINFLLEIIQAPLELSDVYEFSGLYISIIGLCQKMIGLGYFRRLADIKRIYEGVIKMAATDWNAEKLIAQSRYHSQKFELHSISDKLAVLSLKSKMDLADFTNRMTKIRMALCSMLVDLLEVETDLQISRTTAVYRQFNDGQNTVSLYKPTLENQSLFMQDEEQAASGSVLRKTLFDKIRAHVLSSSTFIEKKPYLTNFLIENTLTDNKRLKDFSFHLLEQLYSGGQRLFGYLENLILLDNDQERNLYRRAKDIQAHFFKLLERGPSWINKETSLRVEYIQLLDLVGKVEEDFKEAGRLSFSQLNQESHMSSQLYELSRNHLFIDIHLHKKFDSLPRFYQDIVDKTSLLDTAVKLLNLMLERSISNDIDEVFPEAVISANKVVVDKLILLVCRALYQNEGSKFNLRCQIGRWIEFLTKLDDSGRLIVMKKLKPVFSAKKLGSENSHKLREGSLMRSPKLLKLHERPGNYPAPMFSNLIQAVIQLTQNSYGLAAPQALHYRTIEALVDVLAKTSPQSANCYLMAQCLQALEELTFDGEKAVKESQSLIIKLLADHTKDGVLALYHIANILTLLCSDLRLASVEERVENLSITLIPSQLCLDMAFLSLVTLCTFEKNENTERIAQNILPPRYYLFTPER
jgi:hypothetical protein